MAADESAPCEPNTSASCRESFATATRLQRFVIMRSNFMPMQLQAGHRAAPLAEPMYLRFNACIGLAAERPRFPLACLSGDSGQAESWNTNALLNRWHVNPVSLSVSTYSATVVQQGRRFCSIYNYAAYN